MKTGTSLKIKIILVGLVAGVAGGVIRHRRRGYNYTRVDSPLPAGHKKGDRHIPCFDDSADNRGFGYLLFYG